MSASVFARTTIVRLALTGLASAGLFFSTPAFADLVAIVPAHGGESTADDVALTKTIAATLDSMGHKVTPDADVGRVLGKRMKSTDLTPEDAKAIGADLGVDWVFVPVQTPGAPTFRLEIGASSLAAKRYEVVARDVARDKKDDQIREMLVVLMRPEGVGTGALPWETGLNNPTPDPPATTVPTDTPKTEEPEAPLDAGKTRVTMLATKADVAHPYGADRYFFISVGVGFDALAIRPEGATGSPVSMLGAIRVGGLIPPTQGLEVFAEVGGHLVNAPALYFGGGVRYMFTPVIHDNRAFAFHIGPSARFDGYVRFGRRVEETTGAVEFDGEVAPSFVGSLEMTLGIAPIAQLDINLGELRWIGLDGADLFSAGATVGSSLRF
ncbi:MAG: hypothetical protein U0271_41970 [Polyangiaceae bacterium]